jgi:hypothetical protein
MEQEEQKSKEQDGSELKPDIEVDEKHGTGAPDIKADDQGLGGPDLKPER